METQYRKLTPEEEYVLLRKGTEPPFSGEYDDHFAAGTYTCRRCGAMLYRSTDKFRSGCGWPAFDDEIPGAVRRARDADGRRTEILCANCGGHLGHVFEGEHLTEKNTRHCVNSLSLLFVPESKAKYGRAYFAAGCFWGVEYWLQQQPGVVETTVGRLSGGEGNDYSGAEVTEVLYDPVRTSFERLAKFFFEIHDPTAGSPPSKGGAVNASSALFYVDASQKATALKLLAVLRDRGVKATTTVLPAGKFQPAEESDQDHYRKNGGTPPRHVRKPLWNDPPPAG